MIDKVLQHIFFTFIFVHYLTIKVKQNDKDRIQHLGS